MSILMMPKTIRSTQRLGQIITTAIRHGFGPWVAHLRLRRYLPWSGKLFRRGPAAAEAPHLRIGQRLVAFCEDLGPTFVKLGQLLSSRPDLIPPDWLQDLRALQDHVAAFPTEEAHAIIEKEFGRPVGKLFAEFDPVPLASGSIAQTYRAKTLEGRDVVVKVRRPGIEDTIKLDMYLLHRLAESIEHYIPELRMHRPVSVTEELAITLSRELDLLNEATITERIYRFFAHDPKVVTPSVCWNLTSSRVITLTLVTGRSFHEALADPELYLDRTSLARTLIDAFMRQYLDLNVFNADPHPGNLLIIPPDRIGIVDFGMSGKLDKKRCADFITLLTACNYRHMDLAVDLLDGMNALTPASDKELIKRDLAAFLDKYQALPLRHMNFQLVFGELMALARDHQVILPRDFVLLGKSLVNVGGTALLLDRDLNPNDVVKPRIRQAMINLFNKENLQRELALGLWHGGMLVKDLPRLVRELSRKALRGEVKVQLEHGSMDNLIRELDRSSNRISFALIIAAIIVGSSLIFHARIGPSWLGMPILGLTGYLVAGIMGLWLVIAIIRSGKLS